MNVGIFAVITLVAGYDEQLSLIDDFRGLIYRSPLLGSLLIFFLISLIGIPFTGGFFGKFYSFTAAVGGGAICAGHHRPAQFRIGRGLLPAPRSRRRAATRSRQNGNRSLRGSQARSRRRRHRRPVPRRRRHAGPRHHSRRNARRRPVRRAHTASPAATHDAVPVTPAVPRPRPLQSPQ